MKEAPRDGEAASAPIGVAQLVGTFGGGGAQRLAYNLAEGLKTMGFRSWAIAVREAGGYAASPGASVPLEVLECRRSDPLSLIRGALRLRRLIRRERIQLLHVHGAPSLPFVQLALRGFRARPVVIFTWHDSETVLEGSALAVRRMVRAMRRCRKVFGDSRRIIERLSARSGPKGLEGLEVFRNGVPLAPATRQLEAEEPRIIWAGRLVPPKDPQALIRAAARLKEAGLRFRVSIAGDAPAHLQWFADQTRQLIGELGVADRVEMLGWVEDLPALYGDAAIGVQTSHTEGLSLALLEQMMAGLAVIATDVGDTAEAICHGETGLLVPARDDDALADGLRRLVSDLALRRQVGNAARQLATERFSVAAMAERAGEQYRRLLGIPGGGSPT